MKNKFHNFGNLFYTLAMILCTASLVSCKEQNKVPQENDMAGYLMVYFKEYSHDLFMAVSDDGFTFTDINDGNPVMRGDTLAEQRGIRDPHLFRGPDGTFYLAMTDLHIYAKQEGLRDTEWERDGEKYGWGNNRAIVLMKSKDLASWSRSIVRIDKAFPGYDEVGCIWAPATNYDYEAGKLMLTFTMRYGSGKHNIYYSYVNDDYNKLLTEPKLLVDVPQCSSLVDSDVSYYKGRYQLFYVGAHPTTHPEESGVMHMSSDHATSGYEFNDVFCDPESVFCEAPTCYKLINQDKYILMYDVFAAKPNNMGFSETTDFEHYKDLGHFNEGVMKGTNFERPKHGAVVQVTKEELDRLKAYKESHRK